MKSHSFNLIELCLFLVFLTFISSIFMFSLPKYLEKRKVKQEMETLETLLQAANDWVLFSGNDLKLTFSFEGQSLLLKSSAAALDVRLPLPKKHSFSKIDSIQLLHSKDKGPLQEISPTSSTSSFTLEISENGGHQNPLYLSFKPYHCPSQVYYIAGYPHVIAAEK